jgi:thiamine biosynthesis protein ThiS
VSNSGADLQIEITLNGEKRSVRAGLTVEGLLQELGIAPERVAVELNRQIIRRPAWASHIVEAGAEVEVVQFVGGGQ